MPYDFQENPPGSYAPSSDGQQNASWQSQGSGTILSFGGSASPGGGSPHLYATGILRPLYCCDCGSSSAGIPSLHP